MSGDEGLMMEEEKSLVEQYKIPLALFAGGIFLVLLGIRLLTINSGPQVEFIEEAVVDRGNGEIHVDVSGAVEKPGLYVLESHARVQDALAAAGGISRKADQEWVEKQLNLATQLNDGMKIYVPITGETEVARQTNQVEGTTISNTSKDILNINTASATELETLPGVGEVTAEKIVAGRPYQSIEELLTKKAVNKATFEKIKDRVVIF